MDIGRQKNKDVADINAGDKSISRSHENDLISRQAAINKILGQPPEPHYPSWYAEQIKELPPAEPKRAKWERHYSRPGVFADLCWHCSACGYKSSDGWANKFNFCPNCGSYNGGET